MRKSTNVALPTGATGGVQVGTVLFHKMQLDQERRRTDFPFLLPPQIQWYRLSSLQFCFSSKEDITIMTYIFQIYIVQ